MYNYKKKYNKLLLIDTSNIIHRCLTVPNLFALNNGINVTGGIFGALKVFLSELKLNTQYFPVALFDGGLAPRRLKVYEDYKGNASRDPLPVLSEEEAKTDFLTQYRYTRTVLLDLLPKFGIPSIRIREWEADDLIYICSKLCNECRILSEDRDYVQLVSPTCSVRRPKSNELITASNFTEIMGYKDPEEFLKAKIILGDTSDQIPSCAKGVGPSTVLNLIKLIDETQGNYTREEKELKKLCEDKDIKYRKAFINFDRNAYIRNLQLIDLRLVDMDVQDYIIDSLIAQIDSVQKDSIFNIVSILHTLKIEHLDYTSLIQLIDQTKVNK